MDDKHGVKQTDRLLSNAGIDIWMLFAPWVAFVVSARKELVTLAAYLITSHGRATPLIWRTLTESASLQRSGYQRRGAQR